MKLTIDVSSDNEEELIIKCKNKTEKIKYIEETLNYIIRGESVMRLHIDETEYYIKFDKILFFETYDGQVTAHTDTNMYYTDYKLYELERFLPSNFVRVSKSCILNINAVYSLSHGITGNGTVNFSSCEKVVYISRGYFKFVKDKINNIRLGLS